MANKFVPIYTPNMRENPQIDEDKAYKILTEIYRFDSLKDTTIHVTIRISTHLWLYSR